MSLNDQKQAVPDYPHKNLLNKALRLDELQENEASIDDIEKLLAVAARYTQGIRSLCAANENSSLAILQAIWDVYDQELYMYAGEFNTIFEYLDMQIIPYVSQDDGYIMEMGFFCERIFNWLKFNPVNDPVSGETITVDKLIGRTKIMNKLKVVSYWFQHTTDENRRKTISAIYNETLAAVKKLMSEIKDEIVGSDSNGSSGNRAAAIRIKMFKSYNTDGTVNYTIVALDETSAVYFELLLGDNVEFEFATN